MTHKIITIDGFDEELEASIGKGNLFKEWSEKELAILNKYYPKNVDKTILMKKLNKRTWNAIGKKASELGLTHGVRRSV